MLRQLIKKKLEEANLWYEEPPGSEWVKVKCMNPNHNDGNPSAGINVESGIHHCFSCQHSFKFIKEEAFEGDEADLVWQNKYSTYRQSLATQEDELLEPNTLFLPPVGHPLIESWRGLSASLLADCGAYYCDHGKYMGRNVFPIYMDGDQYGFDARIVDDTAKMPDVKWIRPKGMPVKSIVYPKDVLEKRFKELEHIILAEGVADALSYIEMGIPAIASFGLSPPNANRINTLIAMGVTKITIAFDNDEAGMTGALKVLPAYAEWFEIVSHPMVEMIRASEYKDANEFLEGIKANGLKQTAQEESWDEEFE